MLDNTFCQKEPITLRYFATQLFDFERDLAETHIAQCNACCNTLAHLSRLMRQEETLEEKYFLDKHLQQFAIVSYKLVFHNIIR